MKTNLLSVALIALTSCVAVPAQAQECGKAEDAYAALENKYGEQRMFWGVAANGAVVEFWASDRGTWTSIVVFPDGTACLVASGQDYGIDTRKPNL